MAEYKLQDIFDYYKVNAGNKTARNIVRRIVDRTTDLRENAKLGPVEELLRDRTQQFRYLVVSNYKIIYYINETEERVVVANVFDARQNPEKILDTGR